METLRHLLVEKEVMPSQNLQKGDTGPMSTIIFMAGVTICY